MTLKELISAMRDAEKRRTLHAYCTEANITRLLDALKIADDALQFYGYEAIHNPTCGDKSNQYWNDAGIWDHGDRARTALQQINGDEKGGAGE